MLKHVNPRRATGVDGVPAWLLKRFHEELAPAPAPKENYSSCYHMHELTLGCGCNRPHGFLNFPKQVSCLF